MNNSDLITIEVRDLMQLLDMAATSAVSRFASLLAPDKELISQREAFKLYGEGRVKKWLEAGLLKNRGRTNGAKNSKILYSKTELQQVEYATRVKGALYFRRANKA